MAESRWPESAGEQEARKTEIVMEIALKATLKDWEKNGEKSNRLKELKTADSERSERKMRGRKNTMKTEIIVNSPLTTVISRKELQNAI